MALTLDLRPLVTLLVFVLCLAPAASAQNWAGTYVGAPNERPLALHPWVDGPILVASAGRSTMDGPLVGHLFDAHPTLATTEYSFGDSITGEATASAGVLPVAFVGRESPDETTTVAWFASGPYFLPPEDAARYSAPAANHSLEAIATNDARWADFVAGGWTNEGAGTPTRAWLMTLADIGAPIDQWAYGSTTGSEWIQAVTASSTGAAIVAGRTTDTGSGLSDAWLMKVDDAGAPAWQWALGGDARDEALDVIELDDGRVIACGITESLTISGHAGWYLLADAAGAIIWSVVLGDREWSELVSVELIDDTLLLAGSFREPGDTNAEALFLEASLVDGSLTWQRAVDDGGDDRGITFTRDADGNRVLASILDVGSPTRRMHLAVTDGSTELGTCTLLAPTLTTRSGLLPARSATAVSVPFTEAVAAPFTPDDTGDDIEHGVACDCPPLSCGSIVVDPELVCDGDSQTLTVLLDEGGLAPLTFEWEWDFDPEPEASGMSVTATLPDGLNIVSVRVTDDCDQVARCETNAWVQPTIPPDEVAAPGSTGLRIENRGERVRFPTFLGDLVTVYNLYTDRIGSWHAPSAATGTTCHVERTGELEEVLDFTVPDDSWLLVTSSTRCAEGPAGTDSQGRDRTMPGAWESCGRPTP
ncbi:MAG: hypothetical protein AAF533_20225 [Acidobacteriota bacterium]